MAESTDAGADPPPQGAGGEDGADAADIPAAGTGASDLAGDAAPQPAPAPPAHSEPGALQEDPPPAPPPLQRAPSTDSRTRSLVRQVSDRFSGSIGLAPTFFCQICFDNVPVSDGYTLTACGHRFCRACLAQYIRIAVLERKTDLCCHYAADDGAASPGADSVCKAAFAEADIFALCDEEAAHKYRLFQDDSLREVRLPAARFPPVSAQLACIN